MNRTTEKKQAKLCYEHLGGKLGELLLQSFIAKGWLMRDELGKKDFYITEEGVKGFNELGVDLSQLKA